MKKINFHQRILRPKYTSIYQRGKHYVFYTTLLLFFYSFTNLTAQVTKVYPNSTSSNSHVDNPNNTLAGSGNATLHSYGGIAVGLGNYSGKLVLNYNTLIPAGTTTYVKIDFDEDILNSLVGGELGGALVDLVGNIALGDHYFTVKALNNSSTILSGSSTNGFTNDELRLIVNDNGDYLLALTPNADYNKIAIQDYTNAILLSVANSMNVYLPIIAKDKMLVPLPLRLLFLVQEEPSMYLG